MTETDTWHWDQPQIHALFELPLPELLFRAQEVHRRHFNPGQVQACTLVSIKTGACAEDCTYCSQSARYDTGLEREALIDVETVREAAQRARASGATRLCMGAAWRGPKDRDLETLVAMVRAVKAEGLEACLSAGLLAEGQAERLAEAGLDYFNHNLDTSPSYYDQVVTTRSYEQRLQTLERIRDAGMRVCCGGIVGLGEARADRVEMLATLANLPVPPQSVPINRLIPIPGTPLEAAEPVDPFEIVRTIAATRLVLPRSYVRLAAGREQMSDELQALCLSAGANSLFLGERLLTTDNPDADADHRLLHRLGMTLEPRTHSCAELEP
ncbi:biotin synthase BioB [Halorhodospira halophila]|uniref:Biotin synthase n=1 Tax=Halorhodospira halophila (strain DSM 244 / SL1) TaxID=349124 RepID=BIOB_HALHL|nr:biotin synthase BioB [Halorhodospira halophila]A1WVM7.1 RecName: Full=Biotin synthase [Halorhodospira halophila SL1]ABM61739.1 biotin synthase [Halorhodospira halophila SL1]MBK1728932.1 biotin synthase [Halorhodospira halophila]